MRDGDTKKGVVPPQFIVFEGIDCSGKTTQAARWVATAQSRGEHVYLTREPSNGPIGTMIRSMLTEHRAEPPDTMALLFAADRLSHLSNEVEPKLAEGCTVVCDRYDLSSLTYQVCDLMNMGHPRRGSPRVPHVVLNLLQLGATPGRRPFRSGSIEWIEALNERARRPDLVVILDVPLAVVRERLRARSGTRPDAYEARDWQEYLVRWYEDAHALLPHDKIVHVDGNADIETVAARVDTALRSSALIASACRREQLLHPVQQLPSGRARRASCGWRTSRARRGRFA